MPTKPSLLLICFTTLINCLLFPCTVFCAFTITNNCPFTIWPGTLSGSGTPPLSTTGFQLDSGKSVKIEATPGWSGRMWARTGCKFDQTGIGKCLTGDCGGRLECDGAGATPPASLFEITLGQGNDKDFYDVSIVDGYNLPIVAWPVGGTNTDGGGCNATGCVSDINMGCPKELQVVGGDGGAGGAGGVIACKSACEAFGKDQYCCSGEFANPTTCRPSYYSYVFKRACPRAYSYAFDDGTSTFTCKAYNYAIVFCPGGTKQPNGDTYSSPPSGGYNSPPNGGLISPPSTGYGSTPPSGVPISPPSTGYGSTPPNGVPISPPSGIPISPPSGGYVSPPSGGYSSPPSDQYLSPPGGGYSSPPSFIYNSSPFQKQSHGASEGERSSSHTVLPYHAYILLIFFSLLLLS